MHFFICLLLDGGRLLVAAENSFQKNITSETFGSDRILDSCWSPQKLKGSEKEKQFRKKGSGVYLKSPTRKRLCNITVPVSEKYSRSIRRVDTKGKKLIALTFDIGELNNSHAGYDAEIIDYLRKRKVKARLYPGGKWLGSGLINSSRI